MAIKIIFIVSYLILFFVILFLLLLLRTRKKKFNFRIGQMESDFTLIQNLGTEITSVLEINVLLPKIMEAFAQAGQVKKGSLMLLNEEDGILEIKAGIGLSDRAIQCVRPKLGEGVAGTVASTGKPILINDTSQDKVLYKDYVHDSTKSRPKETLLVLPLIFRGHVIGVINLDAKLSGKPFIRQDETLLSILASQSAVAITNAKLYDLAVTDGLTQLYIHRFFQIRLEQEFNRSQRYNLPVSLIMLDIDKFKSFNDTYGHQVGDLALVHLAKLLQNTVRITDLCARYGGEEFAIILPETDTEEARTVAERFRRKVEQYRFKYTDTELKFTVSLGTATYHGERNLNKDTFIRRADSALYYAKEHGRNVVFAYEQITGDSNSDIILD